MKVLFITDSLTHFKKDLFQEFNRQGIRTHFFTFKGPYTFLNKLKNVVNLVLNAKRTDIVFVDFLSGYAYYSSWLRYLFNRPIFVRCHRFELYEWLTKEGAPKRLNRLRFTVRKVDRIVCVSNAIRKRLISLYAAAERKSIVVHNGVDVKKYHPIKHEPNDPLQIGSLGFLIPRKRFERLIQVVSDLIDEGYGLELHIGGKGPLRQKLEKQIKNLGKQDHILLDGYIPEDEMCQWYALKDLYIQNSFSEGHCVSILQAMSCGLPVFSTDVGGASETLPAKWIYPVNGISSLERELRWFFELPLKERLRIGKENRKRVEEEFDLTKQAQKIIKLLESAIVLHS